jgi:hypothetical protein
MRIAVIEPQRALVWQSSDSNWVWIFAIEKIGPNQSRLISRNRFRLPRLVDRIGMAPMVPASLVMERKMLIGFRERAERTIAVNLPPRD